MATITRNASGDVDIVDNNGNKYNVAGGAWEASAHPIYADTVVISNPSLPGGSLTFKRTDITSLNGGAVPATLSLLITQLGDTVFGGSVGSVTLKDGSSSALVTVAQFHTADNTNPGSGNGLLTGGVAQLKNAAGNLDRQSETGTDSIPALGVATGAAQNAQPFNTTHAGATSPGAAVVFTPAAMSGFGSGSPWSIQVGSVLVLEPTPVNGPVPANQEIVVVTAVTSTTFTAKANKSHAASFSILGFVYNQSRDATAPDGAPGQGYAAAGTYLFNQLLNSGSGGWERERSASGELDGASGSGTAVAAEYEYNGASYDRARSLQGKGMNNATLAAAVNVNDTTVNLSSITGLVAGSPIYLQGGTPERVLVSQTWNGSANPVPIQSAALYAHAISTTAQFEVFAANGPGLNGFTATGIGIEEEALYDPLSGLFYLERSATQDSMPAANIVAESPALFNGSTMDRQRGNVDTAALVTLSAAAASGNSADQVNYNGRGIKVVVNVTAITGTSPSIVVNIQGKDAASGTYYTQLASAAITAVGATVLTLYPGLTAAANSVAADILPRTWRVSYTIAGTTPAVTATVGASIIV